MRHYFNIEYEIEITYQDDDITWEDGDDEWEDVDSELAHTEYDYKVLTLVLDESFQDVTEYKYLLKFNKEYRELGWWLEPGAKEFIKELEEQWFHNKIDTYTLYKDPNFIEFLLKKHTKDLNGEIEREVIEDWSSYEGVEYFIEDSKGNISISGYIY